MPQPTIDIAGLFSLAATDWTETKPWTLKEIHVLGVAAERTGLGLCRHEPVLSFVEFTGTGKGKGKPTRDLQSKKAWHYDSSPQKPIQGDGPESSLRSFVAPDGSVIGLVPLRDRELLIGLPVGEVANDRSARDILDLGAVSGGAGGEAAKKWLTAELGGVLNTRFRLRSGRLSALDAPEEVVSFRPEGQKKSLQSGKSRISRIVRFTAMGVTGNLRVLVVDAAAHTVEELRFRLGCHLVISNFCGAAEETEEKAGRDVLALYELARKPSPVESRPIPHAANPNFTRPAGGYCPPVKQSLA